MLVQLINNGHDTLVRSMLCCWWIVVLVKFYATNREYMRVPVSRGRSLVLPAVNTYSKT
jgi:hypothetical protein